jgi:ribonuclease-3 family protein
VSSHLSKADAQAYNALQLAFIGDCVYSLMVRLHTLQEGKGVKAMHQRTTGMVNAAAQAKALEWVLGILDEEEKDIVRRGRNAHSRHQAPKSVSTAQYSASTGFEALIGYHYLTGQMDRINELLSRILGYAKSEKTSALTQPEG